MSHSSMQMQMRTSLQSLNAFEGTSPQKSRSRSPTGIPETDSELGTASSLSDSLHHATSIQRELPLTMQRWLADTETDRLTRLSESIQIPDDVWSPGQGDEDIPTITTDIPNTQSAQATSRILPDSGVINQDDHQDTSFREMGAWCSDNELRERLMNECTCQAAQRLMTMEKVLRSSLRDLRFVSATIKSVLTDIDMTSLSISEE